MINIGFPGSFHPCVRVEVPVELQMQDDGLMEPGMPIYWYVRARDEDLPIDIIMTVCEIDERSARKMLGDGEQFYRAAIECYAANQSVRRIREAS